MKTSNKKRRIILVSLVGVFSILFSLIIYRNISNVRAQEKDWMQSDWSGGLYDYLITGNVNTYLSSENVTTTSTLSVGIKDTWTEDLLNWFYRRKITFNNSDSNLGTTSERLLNFPVLIKLENGVNIDYSKTNNNGSDIRFTDPDGTLLSYEIELWDETGASFVWVKVPEIDQNSSSDYINIYYGNSSATDSQNASDVWSGNNYKAVWHLGESSGPVIDSSIGGYNGTAVNVTRGSAGFLGKGINVTGNSSYVDFLMSTGNTITVESWAKSTATAFSDMLWCIDSDNRGPDLFFSGTGIYLNTWDGNRNLFCNIPGNVNTWNLYTAVISSLGTKLYINKTLCGTAAYRDPTGIDFHIASSAGYDWEGSIDEFRVSTVVRTHAWTSANYLSQTGSFSSFSNEEIKYEDTGYLISNIFNAGYPSDWGILTYSTLLSNSVTVKARSSNSDNMSGALNWESCSPIISNSDISSNNCVSDANQYIQYRIDFNMTGQIQPPVFESIALAYSASDQTDPVVNAYGISIDGSISEGEWINFEPTIRWLAGEDDPEGNGLLGYYISLNEIDITSEPTASEPTTSSGVLNGFDDGVDNNDETYIVSNTYIDLSSIPNLILPSNKKYYFSIQAVDVAGNYWNENPSGYQNLTYFKYDISNPQNVMYISTPSTNFGSVNDMFFTWPISGQAIANDGESGVLGWQYAINSTTVGSWKGTVYDNDLGISYIPLSSGLSSIAFEEEIHGQDIVVGNNAIYFRTVDIAGNTSTYVTGGINYGGAAPTFPAESVVTITPGDGNDDFKWNNFSLDWPNANFGEGKVLKSYYYMVNTQPPSSVETLLDNSSIYKPILNTSVPAGMLVGAVKGNNVVYVVAIDSDDNYSPTNAIQGTFLLDSELPDPPMNLSLSDTSIKEAELWRISLAWEKPEYTGNGNLTYIIEKSLDSKTWSELARITGNAYSDISSSSREYFYRVASIDSSDESKNNPTYSSVLSITPQGRFTVPAILVSKPMISNVTTRMAVVRWSTDRHSDSKLQYGLVSGEYFESEVSKSLHTTEHTLEMNNLMPGTQYFARAKWTDEDGNTGLSSEFLVQTKPAPVVEDVIVDSIGLNFAILKLTTSGATKAQILYGKTKNYGGSTEINTSTVKSEYSVMITELEDGSEYHYKIVLTDEEGYDYESFEDHMFSTPPRPRVSNIQIQEKKEVASPTVEVYWESNIEVNSIVRYTNEGKTLDKVDMELLKGEHMMEITDLKANSDYQLIVEGVDAMGNRAISDIYSFTTATDTRPPQISNIKSEGDIQSVQIQSDRSRSGQLIISWDTDEPGTSQVMYGEGAGGDSYPFSTQTDGEYRYKHVMIVSNLSPSKVYHFKVVSKDGAGNSGESGSVTAITPKSTDSVVESILGSLSRIFGFL